MVSKIDRLGRTQVEVVNRIHDLPQQDIHVRTLDGLINTRGLGKFAPVLLGLLSGLAKVERSLTRKRTLESIQQRKETDGISWEADLKPVASKKGWYYALARKGALTDP